MVSAAESSAADYNEFNLSAHLCVDMFNMFKFKWMQVNGKIDFGESF